MLMESKLARLKSELKKYRNSVIALDKLNRVGNAESEIRKLGFSQFRIRSHDNLARFEFIPEEMDKASCGKIRKDDIMIIDSPYCIELFTEKTNIDKNKLLFICREVAEWFAEKEVKCVGFGDGVSIENSNEDVSAFHDVFMARNIVFLGVLKDLDKLERDIFFMSYSPLPIKGLDSFPVRADAIEGIEEFSS
jgi:hypothetical protein